MDLKEFGINLRTAREKHLAGVSINRAAQMALVGHSQLKKMEDGELDPQLSTVYRICEKWNVPIGELCCPKKIEPKKTRAIRSGV
jgi:predicted transcriptional regulator